MVIEDLVWSSEAEHLAKTVIKTGSNDVNIGLGNFFESGPLWEVLPDESVGILVSASLPG